jgi:hypothetical protein
MFIQDKKFLQYIVVMKAINAVGWFPLRGIVEMGFVEVL